MYKRQLLYSDWTRGQRRALINRLFNGVAPYTDQEVEENHVSVNYNDLTAPRLHHEATSQFSSAILTPGRFFTASTDGGAKHKRGLYASVVMKEANAPLKDLSLIHIFEMVRLASGAKAFVALEYLKRNIKMQPNPRQCDVQPLLKRGNNNTLHHVSSSEDPDPPAPTKRQQPASSPACCQPAAAAAAPTPTPPDPAPQT